MLLNPPKARLKLGDQHAVSDDCRVIFDHRTAKTNDLLREIFAGRIDFRIHSMKIRRDIGAKGLHLGSKIENIALCRHLGAHFAQ